MLYEFDDKRPIIGAESYVSETAIVVGDVKIGENCYIGHGAILRGDYGSIEIGSGSAIEEGVVVHAPPGKMCKIGERVTVGHGAIIHAESIGEMCLIGMGAVLSVYSRIGGGSVVAEGAVVKMKQVVPEGVVVGGNPARTLRKVHAKDEEYWVMTKEIYIDLAKKYLDLGMKRVG